MHFYPTFSPSMQLVTDLEKLSEKPKIVTAPCKYLLKCYIQDATRAVWPKPTYAAASDQFPPASPNCPTMALKTSSGPLYFLQKAALISPLRSDTPPWALTAPQYTSITPLLPCKIALLSWKGSRLPGGRSYCPGPLTQHPGTQRTQKTFAGLKAWSASVAAALSTTWPQGSAQSRHSPNNLPAQSVNATFTPHHLRDWELDLTGIFVTKHWWELQQKLFLPLVVRLRTLKMQAWKCLRSLKLHPKNGECKFSPSMPT